MKKYKLTLKNKIKEKDLFIRLKNEWEYQNKILEKIPKKTIKTAKMEIKLNQKIIIMKWNYNQKNV